FGISEAISQKRHKQMTPAFYMGDERMEEANGTEETHPSKDYFTRYLCQGYSPSLLSSLSFFSLTQTLTVSCQRARARTHTHTHTQSHILSHVSVKLAQQHTPLHSR